MENRNTSVYLYAALGVVILLAFLSMFGSSSSSISSWFPEDVPSFDSSESLEVNRGGNSTNSQLATAIRDQRIVRMNGLLDQKNGELDELSQKLSRTEARLKDTQKIVDELLGANFTSRIRTTNSGKQEPAKTKSEPAKRQESAAPINAEEMQARLQLAQEAISRLQDEAEQEIANLEDEKQSVLSAAADVLVGLGSAAVPGLVDSLADGDPEIRAWSAYVLGRIGQDASSAVSALQEALSDSDATVREYAQRALNAIE